MLAFMHYILGNWDSTSAIYVTANLRKSKFISALSYAGFNMVTSLNMDGRLFTIVFVLTLLSVNAV